MAALRNWYMSLPVSTLPFLTKYFNGFPSHSEWNPNAIIWPLRTNILWPLANSLASCFIRPHSFAHSTVSTLTTCYSLNTLSTPAIGPLHCQSSLLKTLPGTHMTPSHTLFRSLPWIIFNLRLSFTYLLKNESLPIPLPCFVSLHSIYQH